MKNLFWLFSFMFLLLAGCSQSDPEPNYHVSFTVNGTNKVYTGYVGADFDTSGQNISLNVLGAHSMVSFNDNLGFYIDNTPGGGPIGTGDYTDLSSTTTVLSTYMQNGVPFEAGETMAEDAIQYGVTIPQHFKVTITAIDSETITGTFSGTYYEDGDLVNGTAVNITNGSFHVKRQ